MREQAWTRRIIVPGVVAVALAMTTLVTVPAAAQLGDRGPTGPADRVATFRVPGEGWMTNEPDPTDDGSIIIECMLFDGGPLAIPDRRMGGLAAVGGRAAIPAGADEMLAERI